MDEQNTSHRNQIGDRTSFLKLFPPSDRAAVPRVFREATYYKTSPESLVEHIRQTASWYFNHPGNYSSLTLWKRLMIGCMHYPTAACEYAAQILQEVQQ